MVLIITQNPIIINSNIIDCNYTTTLNCFEKLLKKIIEKVLKSQKRAVKKFGEDVACEGGCGKLIASFFNVFYA